MIYINVIGYWAINLPLSVLLIFKYDFGFVGIWMAIIVAQFFIAGSFQILINKADWLQAAKISQERQVQELELMRKKSMSIKEGMEPQIV